MCPDHGEILGWLRQLRAPVRVAYEAGSKPMPAMRRI
jgi:transposase